MRYIKLRRLLSPAEEAVARARFEDLRDGFAGLVGSDSQIAWAAMLRRKKVEDAADHCRRLRIVATTTRANPEAAHRAADVAELALAAMKAEGDCGRWIGDRSIHGVHILERKVREIEGKGADVA